MSLERGFPWSDQGYNFRGYSIAGQTTSILFENPKICFDIAQGLPFHFASKLFCISHLHADHGSGLNYLLSQRSLHRLPQATIMLPKVNIEPVEKILTEWQKIEGFEYNYQLIGVEHETRFDLNDKYSVMAFATTHRVTSFGYIVYEKKKRLKDEYQNLERQQILDLKSRGTEIEEKIQVPLVAFTGDTQIEFLDSHPDVLKAKYLFMECTYIDEKKSIEETRKWGHIHVDEVIANQHRFENEKVIFIHLSARYGTDKAKAIFTDRFDEAFLQRLEVFPRPL